MVDSGRFSFLEKVQERIIYRETHLWAEWAKGNLRNHDAAKCPVCLKLDSGETTMSTWEVIAGNIGTVFSGTNGAEA